MARRYAEEGEWGPGPSPRTRRRREEERAPSRRSNAAIPLALGVFVAGLILGWFWFLLPALFGLGLMLVALRFLSSRVNPFSIGFYLTVKPSWPAIGTLVLAGLILIAVALGDYASGYGPGAHALGHLP